MCFRAGNIKTTRNGLLVVVDHARACRTDFFRSSGSMSGQLDTRMPIGSCMRRVKRQNDVLMGYHTIANIWVHGAIEWPGEEFACGVESGTNGSSEAWWACLLLSEFKSCALGSDSCGLWVVYLHVFGELLGEVNCWGMFCVFGVEPFVSC